MRKLLLICFLIAIALFSCKKNETVESLQIGTIKNHLVNEKQAIKIAVLKSIFNRSSNSQNRISADKPVQKTIKNTTPINFDQEAPSFYIINYNEGGFIIVAGDDRSMPILAESDAKDFPVVKDAYYPGGLVQWLENTNDVIKTIRINNLPQDSVQKMAWQEIAYQNSMTVKPNDVDPVLPGSCSTEGGFLQYTFAKRSCCPIFMVSRSRI